MTDPELLIERPSSRLRKELRDGQTVYRKEYSADEQGRSADVVRARTAREVDLLHRLAKSGCFRRRLGIPRVIAADPTSAMITTAEIPGQTLETILVGSSKTRVARETCRALWLAGRWLRTFEQTEIRAADLANLSPHEPVDLVEYCSLRMENVLKAGYGWPGSGMKLEIEVCLRAWIDEMPPDRMEKTWCHGDFAPVNLMWDGDKLTTIDFAMARVDLPFVDVTYFLHRLEMLSVYFPWERWPLATWRRAFLAGYGRAGVEQSSLWRAQEVRHLLCRLQTYVRRPTKGIKQTLHRAWILYCLRSKLERILRKPNAGRPCFATPSRSDNVA